MNLGGWDVFNVEINGITQIHCVPKEDLKPHDLRPECWCYPREDDDRADFWIHDSADGREDVEYGRRGVH